jgi:hypothetical protein
MAEETYGLQLQYDPLPYVGSFILPFTEIWRILVIDLFAMSIRLWA